MFYEEIELEVSDFLLTLFSLASNVIYRRCSVISITVNRLASISGYNTEGLFTSTPSVSSASIAIFTMDVQLSFNYLKRNQEIDFIGTAWILIQVCALMDNFVPCEKENRTVDTSDDFSEY